MIRRDTFQTTNCDRLIFNATATTSRFAGAIAHSPENARKYVGFAIQHVRVGELSLRDQPNVTRNVRMRRACPLAVNDFVKIIGIGSVCGFHAILAMKYNC